MYVRTENVMEARDICMTSGARPVKPPNLNSRQNIVNHVIQCYSIASLFFLLILLYQSSGLMGLVLALMVILVVRRI